MHGNDRITTDGKQATKTVGGGTTTVRGPGDEPAQTFPSERVADYEGLREALGGEEEWQTAVRLLNQFGSADKVVEWADRDPATVRRVQGVDATAIRRLREMEVADESR